MNVWKQEITGRLFFFLFLLIVILFSLSPAYSLVLGLMIGLLFINPYPGKIKVVTRYLLQLSIIGLGFGMNFVQVMHAGKDGFVFTLMAIALAIGCGNGCRNYIWTRSGSFL